MGLTPDQIANLLGKSSTRGIYVMKLNEFLGNDAVQGINVREEWPELADKQNKKAASLKQGFENAKTNKGLRDEFKAAAENVRVISNEDEVYLIKTDALASDETEVASDTEAVAV